MDWNLRTSIRKCFIKWSVWIKTFYSVASESFGFHLFVLVCFFTFPSLSDTWRAINRLFREGEAQGGSAVRQSLALSCSHAPCRHILTVPRLFVELWSPNVLRQHLCFHFQFHWYQRPIWRLSKAIVSLCMQNLSALCTTTSGFCAHGYLPCRKWLW